LIFRFTAKKGYKYNWPYALVTDINENLKKIVRHVTGTGSGLLGEIPRVVVQISELL
jgi:hypothetical protein